MEEKVLIKRIRKGDRKAFYDFVEQYKRLVSHIVFRMVSNEAVQEDLCQDIFLKVYKSIGSFRFQSKISTWVGRIAYNTCINYHEKKRVSLYEDYSPEDTTIDDLPNGIDDPELTVSRSEVRVTVREEIEKLPEVYKTILTLYHIDSLSYIEIGEIMDMPDGTVKSYLFRARQMLKKSLMAAYRQEELCS